MQTCYLISFLPIFMLDNNYLIYMISILVPETVEKTKLQIQEGKLLQAHQSTVDLENSRDDLLYELHR